MNLDMTQFGATQNQKQAQARTLLWGRHIKFQPCLAGARVRASEHKVMDRSFYYNENDREHTPLGVYSDIHFSSAIADWANAEN